MRQQAPVSTSIGNTSPPIVTDTRIGLLLSLEIVNNATSLESGISSGTSYAVSKYFVFPYLCVILELLGDRDDESLKCQLLGLLS